MSSYEVTIGLEVHIQLATKSKMFCGCDNDAEGKAPNSVVCPICLGMPGTLPVPNEAAIRSTVKLGRFLGGAIAPLSKFDRKHYFYPDLPKGYQVSQYDWPIVKGGVVRIGEHEIGLTRIHLEEDAGKLLHPKGEQHSLVDLNRAGTPLMEVVTEPEIKTPAEAKAFLQRLRLVVRYLGIASADMEKGQLRCDANISIKKNGDAKLGTPVEVKNLNSFLMVEKALHFETQRQVELLKNGETIKKETRGWDDAKGVTLSQRSKEFAPDYRYFPEPDIPVLKDLDKWQIELPESIESKLEKAQKLGFDAQAIDVIFSDEKLMALWDATVGKTKDDAKLCRRTVGILINNTAARRLDIDFLVEMARAWQKGEIGQPAIKPLIDLALEKKIDFATAVKSGNFDVVSDDGELRKIIKKVLDDNPSAVKDYRAGKEQVASYLVGQAMRASQGQANPDKLRTILLNEL